MSKIVVVGSSNTDMVVKTPRIPRQGETVMGENFAMVPGGKGANQAVAAAKLGAGVTFVACVGTDVFGDQSVANFVSVGIDTSHIVRDKVAPSGVALIFVDEKGENAIAVAPGANGRLSPEDVDRAKEAIEGADVVVCQLEIPVESVVRTFDLAKAAKVRTILNPAPARQLPETLFSKIDIFTPNETEAAAFAGLPVGSDPVEIGKRLLEKGVGAVVMTLGTEGSLIVDKNGCERVPTPEVTPVDTTAAGDAYNGSLAAALGEGNDLKTAAEFASVVAAISVTRMGAQPSMPTREEVDRFLARNR